MIGIIGAMQPEVESLVQALDHKVSHDISGITYYTGELQGKAVVIARCGVGKVCAARCAQTMILHFHAECVINTGVAGALSPSLSIGSIVIATALVQHDMDTTAIGDPLGLISELGVVQMPTDVAVVEKVEKTAAMRGLTTFKGVIASGDIFVAERATKQRIASHFNAMACEMEGGAIAQVCMMNRVPFAVLRAISDTADDSSHMDYPTFVCSAATKMASLVLSVIEAM